MGDMFDTGWIKKGRWARSWVQGRHNIFRISSQRYGNTGSGEPWVVLHLHSSRTARNKDPNGAATSVYLSRTEATQVVAALLSAMSVDVEPL